MSTKGSDIDILYIQLSPLFSGSLNPQLSDFFSQIQNLQCMVNAIVQCYSNWLSFVSIQTKHSFSNYSDFLFIPCYNPR